MVHKQIITELPIEGRKVLVRVDFNVPMDNQGRITDDTRIKASLPTIRYILDNGGSVILMSHLGRPKGKVDSKLSLKPIASRLSDLLGRHVEMAPDCIGSAVEKMAEALKPGEILLLENLRFHDAEEHPELDPSFAKSLANLADFYVNDAFGTSHRAHSSTVEVAKQFPGTAAAGFLLEKEIQFLGATFVAPKHPFVAIVGGAKISTKLGVLGSLIQKTDTILIGGAMAFTFFKALDVPIGKSLCENDLVPAAKQLLEHAKDANCSIILPTDILVAKELDSRSKAHTVLMKDGVPESYFGVDIGPQTIQKFSTILASAETVFWNGPMGVFEIEPFSHGTDAIAKAVASVKGTTVVGGGDSIAALKHIGVEGRITHISTGGGASLEYIELGSLPGIDCLSNSSQKVKT